MPSIIISMNVGVIYNCDKSDRICNHRNQSKFSEVNFAFLHCIYVMTFLFHCRSLLPLNDIIT